MPPFSPFPGIRYAERFDPALVTAPPYDVVDADDRAALVARSDRNAVLFDLPDEADGADRYTAAAATFDAWRADGTLVTDDRPTFTVYRMTYTDDRGRPARTLGVIGALELSGPDEGRILPHEHTTPKARTDRLDLLRATCANLSAIWVLSPAEGLTALLEPDGPARDEWTDDDGVGHATWVVDDPARVAAIAEAVGSRPAVVADGHHRYETALLHRDERRAAAGPGAELGSDQLMALVVELTADELTVRPIHRLVEGLDAEALGDALAPWFTTVGAPVPASAVADGEVLALMDEVGALALVGPDGGATLLLPAEDAFVGVEDLDSARAAHALGQLEGVEVRPQHGTDLVQRAVTGGQAAAGLLLRPATVAQIAENARSEARMPAKTTFFHPKPKTGVVFRAC
ncbi:DUF1015 domain-containing protein [Iamia majanohamensis]|uniref:DUF1015 domain-containing protein n=1 Tax=Iamia majanohamensis TaxID=467976 RepID=A0AAE9Y8P9_9ACTN|nr:DUF1015 domain-containing protein [Iamia majanohamensis]WCO69125.1 DUF1015 domain-containing protein [Iamia majanohamensis]